jgi:hypothetical protein
MLTGSMGGDTPSGRGRDSDLRRTSLLCIYCISSIIHMIPATVHQARRIKVSNGKKTDGWRRHADPCQRQAASIFQLSALRVHVVDCMFRLPILSLRSLVLAQLDRPQLQPAPIPRRPASQPSQTIAALVASASSSLPPTLSPIAVAFISALFLRLSCCCSFINCQLPIDN